MPERIGFVSTRFAGLDGVSLESAKWAQFLWDHQHVSYWYAGRLDRSSDISLCIPEAHFEHPEVVWINERIWGQQLRSAEVSARIHDLARYLKGTLYEYVQRFEISVLVIQNAVTIPMNLPLGIALTEFLCETQIPCIAHHHDFYWERDRFSVNAVQDYLEMAFPPRLPNVQHVVINEAAQEDLAWRKGVPSTLVPNVLDFENPPPAADEYTEGLLQDIGLEEGDVMILQPTRIVPRKGIEHAIKLLEMLGDSKYKLVISHSAGDEGHDYQHMIEELAHHAGVDVRFIDQRIGEQRGVDNHGNKVYTLWDLYPHAAMVTYPSTYEGFGNALIESFYFKVPVLVNKYSIFIRDIAPRGFQVAQMDGYVTRSIAEEVRRILEDPGYRQGMVDQNYELAARYYSYSVLRRKLRSLVTNITGLDAL